MINRARFVNYKRPNIMTYGGTWVGSKFVPFKYLHQVNGLEQYLIRDFNVIKYMFACDTIRIVIRPYSEYSDGFKFPILDVDELDFLRTFCHVVNDCGLKLFPVLELPERYMYRDPEEFDDFYTTNGRRLIVNYSLFRDIILNLITIASRNVYKIGVCNDFDPLNIFGPKKDVYQEKWHKVLFKGYENSIVCCVGNAEDPFVAVKEVEWLEDHNSTKPYSFKLFSGMGFIKDFKDLIETVYDLSDGNMLIEETGNVGDKDYNKEYFKAVFDARNRIDSMIPVGIYTWGDSSINTRFGLNSCWKPICAGSSGAMWSLKGNTATVYASEKKSNFLVIPFINDAVHLKINSVWCNVIKAGEVYVGDEVSPKAESRHKPTKCFNSREVQTYLAYNGYTYLWYSLDFNLVNPSLKVEMEIC